MSVAYRAVQWNRHKKVYDLILVAAVPAYIAVFIIVGFALWPDQAALNPTAWGVTLLMRATSTCAITMLSVILMIGPLARLSPKFSPLLYNRRHFGVTMFLVALVHAVLAVFWYHAFGAINPIVSVFVSNANYGSLAEFPFQPLGVAALLILFFMAATSHDFWLKNLTPPVWKTLHMLVYVAYGLVVMHVTLGFLQDRVSAVYPVLLGTSAVVIIALHLLAGFKEWQAEGSDGPAPGNAEGWVDVGQVDEIEESRAKVVKLKGHERIAVFRHDGKLSAISNVCAHQNGPLGEGKIVDGCVTCPWHGYQYLAHNGQSPPPFTEKVPTYKVRVRDDRILLNPRPHPPGTPIEPAIIGEPGDGG